jgi:hypothetical protein
MKPINDTSNSMAIHVIAYAAIANLKAKRWRRVDAEEWLQGIEEPTQQEVRDKLNEVLKLHE